MYSAIGILIVGLFAIGMAIAFYSSDRQSPTSRALAAFWALLGIGFISNLVAFPEIANPRRYSQWAHLIALLEPATMVAGYEWILRVGRTQPSQDPRAPHRDRLIKLAQVLAFVYATPGAISPELRQEVWLAWRPDAFLDFRWYLFAVPFYLSLVLTGIRAAQLFRTGLDPAEQQRFLALGAAGPFWIVGTFVHTPWIPISYAVGEVIFLIGAIRYHVRQGQRGQFLAIFRSPDVARLVEERGIASALQRERTELSVVSCDLRGFTAFSETAAPEEVMKLLSEYYTIVGEVVGEFGGSIKDMAGDGILALVGAPIPRADHADRATAIAVNIRARMKDAISHWRNLGFELGVGIGVASGFATVGTLGSAGRLEYVAVGPAVNLASRLCARAESGQILVDQRLRGSLTDSANRYRFEKLEDAELKGFARPVAVFAVMPATVQAAAAS
jgi:class 3 adenylate cyclase